MTHQDDPRWQLPPSEQPRTTAQDTSYAAPTPKSGKSIGPLAAIPVAGLLLLAAGFVLKIPILSTVGLLIVVLGLIGVVIAAVTRGGSPSQQAQPLAYTEDGRPVYPVVGYTPEGTPITADRAIGYRPPNPHTNSLAVTALVLGFVFPLLAIPIGHAARSQIRRTGEQGGGMALAGLILGYLSLLAVAAVIVFFAVLIHGVS